MALSFEKCFALLKASNITTYQIPVSYTHQIQREHIVASETWKKMQVGKDINTVTIQRLCKLLRCQPGDLMEYIPEDDV